MSQGIRAIRLLLPYRLGSVNSYLIETETGYVLIDTGASNQRTGLEKELESAGCKPGTLKLIVLTHGDFDHSGNAAYLRKQLGAPIAMHPDDSGMAERGDMFWNRKRANRLLRMLSPVLFRFGKSERFTPDVYVEDGTSLCEYGFDAQVLAIPGHSRGSIGILTAECDLFCGDLLESSKEPVLNAIMDDLAAANASVEKLQGLEIRTVYPGHGRPFPMELFIQRC
jgi:hydroxyacylglutathione hydrolase